LHTSLPVRGRLKNNLKTFVGPKMAAFTQSY
jgi:hypothetical protein